MKGLRLAFLSGCLVLLAGALRYERHEVQPLAAKGEAPPAAAPEVEVLDGLAFTEVATVDGLLRADGVLYDVYSVGPVSAEAGLALDVKKECPT